MKKKSSTVYIRSDWYNHYLQFDEYNYEDICVWRHKPEEKGYKKVRLTIQELK